MTGKFMTAGEGGHYNTASYKGGKVSCKSLSVRERVGLFGLLQVLYMVMKYVLIRGL
jgi:hypothetical protein